MYFPGPPWRACEGHFRLFGRTDYAPSLDLSIRSFPHGPPNLRRQFPFAPHSVSGELILKSAKVWKSSLVSQGGPERQAFPKLVILLGP